MISWQYYILFPILLFVFKFYISLWNCTECKIQASYYIPFAFHQFVSRLDHIVKSWCVNKRTKFSARSIGRLRSRGFLIFVKTASLQSNAVAERRYQEWKANLRNIFSEFVCTRSRRDAISTFQRARRNSGLLIGTASWRNQICISQLLWSPSQRKRLQQTKKDRRSRRKMRRLIRPLSFPSQRNFFFLAFFLKTRIYVCVGTRFVIYITLLSQMRCKYSNAKSDSLFLIARIN